ncbi:hypothetical protein [Paeniglutamicibacter cryotolerans]|uniref:Uncharacterized protein n=1 Tax=Paeniglutamicibacter cryotolerans TaxID=670079 RepID=A0A839QD87_9MICC|nr:hypothetical protein [Paeniglutamicibacter cryotolerans]MBB2994128.1 hypothetical protein [Paeniglutamicibacter cryotolerans]
MGTKNNMTEQWIDAFILELRLSDVGGRAIGDAVAQVREFLADSGQEPTEAFGEPRDHVSRLGLPAGDGSSGIMSIVMAAGLSTLALTVYIPAIGAFISGELVEFAAAQLALLSIPVLAIVLLPLYFTTLVRHRWALISIVAITIGSAMTAGFLGRSAAGTEWLVLDAGPLALAMAALLLIGAVWSFVELRRTPADHIVEPLSRQPASRKSPWVDLLPSVLFIAVAAVATLVVWLVN